MRGNFFFFFCENAKWYYMYIVYINLIEFLKWIKKKKGKMNVPVFYSSFNVSPQWCILLCEKEFHHPPLLHLRKYYLMNL